MQCYKNRYFSKNDNNKRSIRISKTLFRNNPDPKFLKFSKILRNFRLDFKPFISQLISTRPIQVKNPNFPFLTVT